ncbi:MAG: alpha/beta fold hydrolase [Bryobacteraceae bacterium]
MAYADNAGTRLYWEEQGEGEPILMIMGLSFTLDMWFRITPVLSKRYRLILFDNRGVGRSDTPRGPYSMRQMADDAVAVMEAAGVSSAYVMGASMGGMIAQELALRYPKRVRALLLGCTSGGALGSKLPHFRRLPITIGSAKTYEEREWLFSPLIYADSTPKERIEEDIQVRLRYPQLPAGFYSQFAAILAWSSYRRLHQIEAPTLVMHGDEDRLVPMENGLRVARRIRHAQFVKVPGAGHVISTDQPEIVDDAVLRFLSMLAVPADATQRRTA